MLNADEHQDLRTSIYAGFFEDEQRGANMIVAFAAERNVVLSVDDVVAQLNALDDEEIDIKMTPEFYPVLAGQQNLVTLERVKKSMTNPGVVALVCAR